jgi:hypothetical protein
MPARIDPIKAKQRRQKQIAIGGAALLLVLVAIQGPKLWKQLHSSSSTPAWLQASRAQAATGAPISVSTPPGAGTAAPAVGVPDTSTPSVPAAAGSVLVSDQAPTAGPGQLSSFGTFSSKDPFAAQVKVSAGSPTPADPVDGYGIPNGGSAGAGSPAPAAGGSVVPGAATPPATTTPAVPAPTSAVIAVNGVLASVNVGTDFPTASPTVPAPLFHLVSLTQHTAKIAIAGGSYADGVPTVTLVQGKSLTLENTADGTRYKLKLYPQGTQVPTTQTTTVATTTKKEQQPVETAPIVTTPLVPTTALSP